MNKPFDVKFPAMNEAEWHEQMDKLLEIVRAPVEPHDRVFKLDPERVFDVLDQQTRTTKEQA